MLTTRVQRGRLTVPTEATISIAWSDKLMDSATVAGSCYTDSSLSVQSFARLGSSLSAYGGMSCGSVSFPSVVDETNLGSKLSAARDVLLMQSLSVKKEISDANFVLQTGERVPASCEMSIERLLLISSSISLPVITI